MASEVTITVPEPDVKVLEVNGRVLKFDSRHLVGFSVGTDVKEGAPVDGWRTYEPGPGCRLVLEFDNPAALRWVRIEGE